MACNGCGYFHGLSWLDQSLVLDHCHEDVLQDTRRSPALPHLLAARTWEEKSLNTLNSFEFAFFKITFSIYFQPYLSLLYIWICFWSLCPWGCYWKSWHWLQNCHGHGASCRSDAPKTEAKTVQATCHILSFLRLARRTLAEGTRGCGDVDRGLPYDKSWWSPKVSTYYYLLARWNRFNFFLFAGWPAIDAERSSDCSGYLPERGGASPRKEFNIV